MLAIRENVPLAHLSTFQIGGNAKHFCEISTEGELREAFLWARSKGVPFIILGGGSNVLVPDDGLNALVIRIVSRSSTFDGTVLTAEAGCDLLTLIRKAAVLSLGGWENLAGIPGTIGGAVRGNAGAFGTEIKDVLVTARALNAHTLVVRDFTNAECEFSYRMSYFKRHPEWIILSEQVRLARGAGTDILASIERTIAERERRHIQNVRAAGSFFVNPVAPAVVREQFEKEKGVESREGRVPAGWLIEKVGLKGAREGGAEASMMHPNYLVNREGATARDVMRLAERIQNSVQKSFGIRLEPEAAIFS